MATIGDIEKAMEGYYDYHNQTYTGQFREYCEDNGYDTDTIRDELINDNCDTDLIEFDDDFPLPIHVKTTHKAEYIYNQLKLFYENPSITYPKEKVFLYDILSIFN